MNMKLKQAAAVLLFLWIFAIHLSAQNPIVQTLLYIQILP